MWGSTQVNIVIFQFIIWISQFYGVSIFGQKKNQFLHSAKGTDEPFGRKKIMELRLIEFQRKSLNPYRSFILHTAMNFSGFFKHEQSVK